MVAYYQHIYDSYPAYSTKLTKYLVIFIASIAMGAMTDTEFDAYWEEEARNPHRNRIRIGRQYQATIPPRLKAGKAIRAYSLFVGRSIAFMSKRSHKFSPFSSSFFLSLSRANVIVQRITHSCYQFIYNYAFIIIIRLCN